MTTTSNATAALDLASIKVLYRDGNHQLWGVPYTMRPGIGQTPRHLFDAGQTTGWIWLGASSGWWATMSAAHQGKIEAFLAQVWATRGRFCDNAYEWDDLTRAP